MDLGGIVRLYQCAADMDAAVHTEPVSEEPLVMEPVSESVVELATGTTALLCPPRISGVGQVALAVGRLDGTIALVATGLGTPGLEPDQVAAAGTVLDQWASPGSAVPTSLAWCPNPSSNGSLALAVGRMNGMVEILTRQKSHRFHQHATPVRALSYTPDGTLLLAGGDQGLVCVWDTSSSNNSNAKPVLVHHHSIKDSGWILHLSVLSDSRRFITLHANKTVQVWKVGQLHQALHTFHADHTAWTADVLGNRLVTASDTGWLQAYSLEKS